MSPLRIAIGLCLTAAVTLLAVRAVAQPPVVVERIAAGVTAAGHDVSGLTVEEASARLQQAYGRRLERGAVSVRASGLRWRLTTRRARVRFDALRSARRALQAGRTAQGQPVDVPLAVDYSRARVERLAGRIDRRLRCKPRNSRLRISVTRVRVTHSRRGRDLDGRRLAREIGRALRDPRLGRVFKPELRRPKAKVTAGRLRRSATTVITIHQATFTLRLIKNFRVVRRYKVAVGQPAYPTPRGLFAIQSKQVNPVWSVPNSPWAGELAGTTVAGGSAANPLKARWLGVAGGVGIHGTGVTSSIGTRASHGCIRMHVADVIELFGRVSVGTPVLIA
ncbi:MAG: L,D-transpeptidase [Thermoleophilia bacterium]